MSGKQGASGIQGCLGGVQRGGNVQKGNAGSSCLHWRCLHPLGWAEAGRGGEVSVRGPPAPPPCLSHSWFGSNHPGGGALHGQRGVASSSACCQGAVGQRTSGPQLPKPDHPRACRWMGGRWAGTRRPTMAWKDFILSLGVRGLHGGGWCCRPPRGHGWSLVPSPGAPVSSDCLGSTSPPPEMLGCSPPTRGSHGGNNALCPSQALCPQSREDSRGAGSGQQFLKARQG